MLTIVFTAFFFVAAFFLEEWFDKRSFGGLGFTVKTNRRLSEIGETVEVRSTIRNESKIPVNYLSITEKLPAGELVSSDIAQETITDDDFFGHKTDNSISSTYSMYLLARSEHTVTRRIFFNHRGRFIFHGASVTRGDFLGIGESLQLFDTFVETVVLPKKASLDRLPDLMCGLIGDYSVRRFIHEDPVLTIGYREYTGREPMKAISWTQSAKTGQLIVKKYDHTTDFTVSVILNTECEKNNIRCRTKEQTENIEYALSLARSVFEYLDERRIPYSYTTNAAVYGGRRIRLSMRSGFGNTHLLSVLENLGRTSYDTIESFGGTVREIVTKRVTDTAFIVITAEENEEFTAEIGKLAAAYDCLVLNAGRLREEDTAYEG